MNFCLNSDMKLDFTKIGDLPTQNCCIMGFTWLLYTIILENGKNEVSIIMTLTTPGCMMGDHMASDIKQKLENLDEIEEAKVTITFDPPWEPSMMNDEAREKLGFNNSQESKEKSDNIDVDWD